MKRLIIILSTIFFLSSCVKDLREPLITIDGKEVQEGYALVDFSVNVPSGHPGTKAFADTPEINNLYIAVFDQNRYLEDYVEAISKGPVSNSQDGTYPDVNYNDKSAKSTTWNFQATLPISTEPRYLHFIANSPVDKLSFGREDEVIGDLATEAGQDAYWQVIDLPGGITVDNQGILSTSVQAKMKNVALIRNFSKISVTASPVTSDQNSSNFKLEYIYVMNRPTSGTIAPYNALKSSFIQNYQNYTSDELKGTSIARQTTQTVGRPIAGVVYEGSTTQSDILEKCILEGSSPAQYVYLSRSKATGNAVAGKTYYSKTPGTPIYDGWMPIDFDIDRKNPGDAGPENPNWISPTVTANGENYANDFLYERTKPASATDNPVCVLVYGTYYGDKTNHSQGIKCYYKIDIKDGDDKYFAILRNFDYKINIKKVNAIGRLTVEDAMVMPGSGNVSTDITNEDKTNISDGVSRIAVSFTDTTIVSINNFTLKYKFIPDFKEHANVPDNNIVPVGSNQKGQRVTVTTEGEELFELSYGRETDKEGYNTITFIPRLTELPDEAKIQKLKITGVAVDGSTISREITVVLREKMVLGVYCDPESIDKKTGTEFDVVLKIPNELNRMLFPLEIKIESSNLTITPAQGDNLPVSSGISIDPNNRSEKTSFYFIKTVSFQDYSNAYLSEDGNREIRCHFKSNTDISATTIWAANQYFNTGSTTLGNYDAYNFKNLRFVASGSTFSHDVNFTFDFETEDGYNSLHNTGKPVTVTLVNLRPQDGDESLEGGTPSTKIDGGYEYTFTPTGLTNNTFQLTAAAAKGPYIVYLDADHFRQAEKRRTRTITIAAKDLTFKNNTNNDLFGNRYSTDVNGIVIVRADEYDTDLSGQPSTSVTRTSQTSNRVTYYTFKNSDAMTVTVDADATEIYFLYNLNGTIYSGSRTITPGDSNINLTGEVTFSKRKTQGILSISDMSLYVGDSKQVSITENTNTNAAITYEISDPSVISITNGVVTALKAGTVTVTATAAATTSHSKAQTTFKVTVSRLAVDITVNDTVSGDVKSGLTIKNTGGSRIYIRAIINANWYDNAGNIVAPLSAAPGTFVGLPGNGWEEEGGIYYYTSPLDPNASPTALFSKYTKAATPPVAGATLKMTIYVQALEYVEGKTCKQVFQD